MNAGCFAFIVVFTGIDAACQRHAILIETLVPIGILFNILETAVRVFFKLTVNLPSIGKWNLRNRHSHWDNRCDKGSLKDIVNGTSLNIGRYHYVVIFELYDIILYDTYKPQGKSSTNGLTVDACSFGPEAVVNTFGIVQIAR